MTEDIPNVWIVQRSIILSKVLVHLLAGALQMNASASDQEKGSQPDHHSEP
jgi:hypothetical protein